jgi:hypothetical protein
MQTQNNPVSGEFIKATYFLRLNYLARRLSDKAPANKLIQSDNLHSICFPTPLWPPSGHKSAVRTCNEGEEGDCNTAWGRPQGSDCSRGCEVGQHHLLDCWKGGGGGVSKESPKSAYPICLRPQCPFTPCTQGRKQHTYVVRGKSHQTSRYGKVRPCRPCA